MYGNIRPLHIGLDGPKSGHVFNITKLNDTYCLVDQNGNKIKTYIDPYELIKELSKKLQQLLKIVSPKNYEGTLEVFQWHNGRAKITISGLFRTLLNRPKYLTNSAPLFVSDSDDGYSSYAFRESPIKKLNERYSGGDEETSRLLNLGYK